MQNEPKVVNNVEDAVLDAIEKQPQVAFGTIINHNPHDVAVFMDANKYLTGDLHLTTKQLLDAVLSAYNSSKNRRAFIKALFQSVQHIKS